MDFYDYYPTTSTCKNKEQKTKKDCLNKLEEILNEYLLSNNIDSKISKAILTGLKKDFYEKFENLHCYTLSSILQNNYLTCSLISNNINPKKLSHLSVIVKENLYILVSHSSYKYPVLISY